MLAAWRSDFPRRRHRKNIVWLGQVEALETFGSFVGADSGFGSLFRAPAAFRLRRKDYVDERTFEKRPKLRSYLKFLANLQRKLELRGRIIMGEGTLTAICRAGVADFWVAYRSAAETGNTCRTFATILMANNPQRYGFRHGVRLRRDLAQIRVRLRPVGTARAA